MIFVFLMSGKLLRQSREMVKDEKRYVSSTNALLVRLAGRSSARRLETQENAFEIFRFSERRRVIDGMSRGFEHRELPFGSGGGALDSLEKIFRSYLSGTGCSYQNTAGL
jgi:hypothetical protein